MTPPPGIAGYNIVWADAFSGPQGSLPDSTNNWFIVTAGPNAGNNEVQTYTANPANVSLSGNGILNISPIKDANGNWTSARLECKASFECDPGHKMILQSNLRIGTAPFNDQAGIWPAFWTLGASIRASVSTPWPECGEWDIMENAHGAPWTLASLHYAPDGNQAHERSVGGQVGTSAEKSLDPQAFNTFTITVDRTPSTWQNESLTWSLNGVPWFTAKGSDVGDQALWANCAQKPYYPILNVAVGSNFPSVGGRPDNITVSGLGAGLQVNYVAFYKSVDNKAAAPAPSQGDVQTTASTPVGAGTTHAQKVIGYPPTPRSTKWKTSVSYSS